MNNEDKKIEKELKNIDSNFEKLYKNEQEDRDRFLSAPVNRDAVRKAIANMEISEKIYKLRKKSQLTQKQLADKLHIKQPTYARMENGQNLTIFKIYDIADACNSEVRISFLPKHA